VALPWAKPISGRGRPRIKIPYTGPLIVLEVAALALLIALVAYTVVKWPGLPSRFPTHFTADGVADTFGGRGTLVTFPILAVLLYVGLTLLRRAPWGVNYGWAITPENAEIQYRIAVYFLTCLKMEVVALLAYIQYQTIATGLGDTGGAGPLLLPITIMVVLGTLVVYLWASQRNR
jgi:uncharacterized membrane protein